MANITEEMISTAAATAYERSLKLLPEDIVESLEKAYHRENEKSAKVVLEIILQNNKLAREKNFLICQDTGMPRFFVNVGLEANIGCDIEKAIRKGTEQITKTLPLIAHSVHPLTRFNPGTNVGHQAPIIHYDVNPSSKYLEITAAPVSAIEDRSAAKVFDVVEGTKEEIKKFILNTVAKAGTVCPPLIIGIGCGGSLDTVGKLASTAAMRPLNQRNPDPEIAFIEAELLEEINQLGIGPMNLGGNTTALAVNMEIGYTHSVCVPVAVRTECWCTRRASVRIDSEGNMTTF